eukprot:TRINITY_DN16210_c0_g1_i2.p1 TRINITY_DN16210_c0_g1~~TRINITY_DN16210_c0_g1_i2.p1  ORF type:complete len:280 (+),score=35.24 TRINITY_DN16210_c0_g1_i2:349-1188(+)
MGFGERWRMWTQECISSAWFSILLNGSPKGYFLAGRGLRQGVPLSHFLFLIEAFGKMIKKAVSVGFFEGFRAARNSPEISHLQYADDTLIFCGAEEDQVRNVKTTILCFEAVLGLKVNFFKSEVIGLKFEKHLLIKCSEILGCKIGELPVLYLRMPLCSGRVSKSLWNPVLERVEGKLSSWKAKYLSIGGRATLIKSVLSNLPVYYFSIFRCPVSIIKRLERLQIDFLWHGTSSQKKLHLVDWESICKPKDEGGLGIRPLKKMNQALLGKWLWRIEDGS